MKLLATIKPEDIDTDSPSFEYRSFKSRTAGRAIVFDGEKVALIHITEHDYYMLPGGGIEGDVLQIGLAREILEERGCEIEITGEVGCAEVYFDRWQQKQTDYCYAARRMGKSKDARPTDFEMEEGHKVIWVHGLEEAIQLVRKASPKNRDGKLVRARDLIFLESARQIRL